MADVLDFDLREMDDDVVLRIVVKDEDTGKAVHLFRLDRPQADRLGRVLRSIAGVERLA